MRTTRIFCVLFLCTIFLIYHSVCKWWAHNHDYEPIFRSDSCLHIALNIHERTCILIKSCQNKGDSGVIISMLHGFYKPDLLSHPFFRVDWYCLFLYNETDPVYDKHGPYSLISDIFWDFPLPLWCMQNKSTSWSVGFFFFFGVNINFINFNKVVFFFFILISSPNINPTMFKEPNT